jgi:hypothetical protein
MLKPVTDARVQFFKKLKNTNLGQSKFNVETQEGGKKPPTDSEA